MWGSRRRGAEGSLSGVCDWGSGGAGAGGRSRRRGRQASYGAGSLAVTQVTHVSLSSLGGCCNPVTG